MVEVFSLSRRSSQGLPYLKWNHGSGIYESHHFKGAQLNVYIVSIRSRHLPLHHFTTFNSNFWCLFLIASLAPAVGCGGVVSFPSGAQWFSEKRVVARLCHCLQCSAS